MSMTDKDDLLARYQRALEAIAGSNNGPAGWIAHEALTGDPGHPRGLRMLDVEREMLAGFVRAFVADTDPEYWPDGVADWLTTKEPK